MTTQYPHERESTEYSEVMRKYPASTHRLRSFLVRPSKFSASILEQDEKVLLLLRRHWITNLSWLFPSFIMCLVPLLYGFIPHSDLVLPLRFVVGTIILWYLLIFGILVNGFLSWFYNVLIITDERVIDVDFLNLIYKNVSATKIENIEDVTYKMAGTIRSILNYGIVMVQTAGEKTEFEFEDVPNPQEVAKFLNEMLLEEEREDIEGRVK